MASGRTLIGAIEGGGTKFVCAVAESPTSILERATVATRSARVTLADCLDFFQATGRRHGPIAALGFACFGPLQLRANAPNYGCLLDTPKPGWSGIDLVSPLRCGLQVPVVLDTDVGAAARGELADGAARGLGSACYVTVGTGIGGAMAPAPQSARLLHEEMGHLIVRRDRRDLDFPGSCPFHGDCLEGLASGSAIMARWGCDLSSLPEAHPGRSIIAGYIAQLVVAIALLHSPEVVVIGGGVMSDGTVLPKIREAVRMLLGGYLPPLRDAHDIAKFILAPGLAGDSAIVGAVHLALDTLVLKEST